VTLTLSGPGGQLILTVDTLGAPGAPHLPTEEVHWVADAPGEVRIALTSAAFRGPCGLRLAEQRQATTTDRRRALAEAELARAHALRRPGRPERCRDAVAPYESAQRRFAVLGLPRRRTEALVGLGQLQRYCLHDNVAALRAFSRALPLLAGDPAFEALVRQHLGELRYLLGDFDGAIADDRRGLELSQRLGDRQDEARDARNLANALYQRGRYDEAAALFDRALALCPPEDFHDRAQTLLGWGHLHRLLGENDRARERFQAALAVSRQGRDRDDEAAILNALGSLALDEGRPGAALQPLAAALALRSPGSRGWAVSLTSLGVAYRQLDRLDEARRLYAEAVPIFHRVGDAREEARALGNLARLEATTRHDTAALDHFDRALGLLRGLADPLTLARVLEGKAWVSRRQGDFAAARRLIESALAAVEQHRLSQASYDTRADFFAAQQGLYDFLVDLLMAEHRAPDDGYAAAALEVSERSLARSLLDRLAANGPDRRQPRPARAVQIQRDLLDRDTLLLEYRLGETRSFLWAVTPGSLSSVELPARAEVERVVRRACDLLARSRSRQAEVSAGIELARLSRLLLDPVARLLPGKRLVVVGDGALQSLPFAALPEPGGGEPLIARHEVVSLPSISVLGALRREAGGRSPTPRTLWVLADPDFGRGFEPLPHTREESAAIQELVPASRRFAVSGREASRAAVLGGSLRDYRFLHFATHGSFAAADPRLVLAQVDPHGRPAPNGFLHLADIYQLSLRADLVVLSACQSALGREVRGEGMMGMTRGFFYAGAERVLVSLWNVNDRATAELMRDFYGGMLREGLTPAAALWQAQERIRSQRRWRSPYYWAAFTLQGEWRGAAPMGGAAPVKHQANSSKSQRPGGLVSVADGSITVPVPVAAVSTGRREMAVRWSVAQAVGLRRRWERFFAAEFFLSIVVSFRCF